jgi:hypothetical protein
MSMNPQFNLLPKGFKSFWSGIALHGALSDIRRSMTVMRSLPRIRKGIINPYLAASYNLICPFQYVKELCSLTASWSEADDSARGHYRPPKPAAFVVVRIPTNFLLTAREDYRVEASYKNGWSR